MIDKLLELREGLKKSYVTTQNHELKHENLKKLAIIDFYLKNFERIEN